MADLKYQEKQLLEKLLGMSDGIVLDFSNRTFQEFIEESIGIDIYNDKYNYESGSKANRLRAFWNIEDNYQTALLLEHMLHYLQTQAKIGERILSDKEITIYKECQDIVLRLKEAHTPENITSIQPNKEDIDFTRLANLIRNSIEKNEPEIALDRLHTFVIKYVRELCIRHLIQFDTGTPLHSLFGSYVKHLKKNNVLESTMSERILKSSISILEAFNDVRNNRTYAHDNQILNYNESMLIFNNISNIIRFIELLENDEKKESDFG